MSQNSTGIRLGKILAIRTNPDGSTLSVPEPINPTVLSNVEQSKMRVHFDEKNVNNSLSLTSINSTNRANTENNGEDGTFILQDQTETGSDQHESFNFKKKEDKHSKNDKKEETNI